MGSNRIGFWTVFAAIVAAATTNCGAQSSAAVDLPAPYATPSVTNRPRITGWPADQAPTAPDGFQVTALVRGIESPRWIYVLPNGDVLVAQSRYQGKDPGNQSPNQITLFRDADHDGTPELQETFLTGLRQPLGMALLGSTLYVANTNGVLAFPYEPGQTRIDSPGKQVIALPAGGYNNHWTRNLLASRDGSKLFVSVGSASNAGEYGIDRERMRAGILEMNPDGSDLREFATGLRNPVGMDWEPQTGVLWTAVNERDGLGDDLVPDYMTSVRDGGFYGWPYSYFGQNEDPRLQGQRPDLVAKAIVPDYPLGAHTASLGLVFYRGEQFPERYRGGAFVSQRGSWNRSQLSGYRIAYVPFENGKPAGPLEDFLTGFVANEKEVYGRPVGIAVAADGALLVADEPGNTVWRVAAEGK